jgi:hypothetical protein
MTLFVVAENIGKTKKENPKDDKDNAKNGKKSAGRERRCKCPGMY